jgi:transmembrane sensor
MEKVDRSVSEISAQAAEWVVKLAAGLTPALQRKLDDWIASSPDHLEEFLLSVAIYRREMGISGHREWVPAELEPEGHAGISQLSHIRRHPWAVSLLLVLAIVGIILLYWQPLWGRSVQLPDGSVVLLTKEAIGYRHFNRAERHIGLWSGGAFFDVKHDSLHPFVVSADRTVVRAVGTAFGVRLLPNGTTVTVASGRVQVEWSCKARPGFDAASSNNDNSVFLGAGEQITISTECILGRPNLSPTELDRQLAWIHEELSFDHLPLLDVANRFNRYNRRQLLIADQAIERVPISGGFDARNLRSFIAALELMGIKPVGAGVADSESADIILAGPTCQWNGVRCIKK